MKNSKTLITLIISLIFTINSFTLFLYLSTYDHKDNRLDTELMEKQKEQKPWPLLPSYLPWFHNHHVSFGSCEAYFGNGFTRRFDLLNSSSSSDENINHRKFGISSGSGRSSSGWFRCSRSDTLDTSVCEGGMIRMHPHRIRMSNGGEALESVMGRPEDDEFPLFESGAFDIKVAPPPPPHDINNNFRNGGKLLDQDPLMLNRCLPQGQISRHTMRDLMDSIRLVPATDFHCSEWVEEPTLLVTRYEYANLFHTVTDWYSAYVASRVTGLPSRPHLVFVDGHCMTPLEETWKAMFSSLRYAKSFSGPVCFCHAILSPLGYETVLFKGLTEEIDCRGAFAHDLQQHPDERRTARISEFGEMIRAAFGFPLDRHQTSKPVSGHNILFIRREDYLAHPRHGGKVQSRLSNEEEVFNSIKDWVVSTHLDCEINLINGVFAHMPMKEQLRAIQDASVIIGAHGAGLTHIVSATPETVVLEIMSAEFIRPHFALIGHWKGLEYHPIFLEGYYANPAVVVDKLSIIMRGLGC